MSTRNSFVNRYSKLSKEQEENKTLKDYFDEARENIIANINYEFYYHGAVLNGLIYLIENKFLLTNNSKVIYENLFEASCNISKETIDKINIPDAVECFNPMLKTESENWERSRTLFYIFDKMLTAPYEEVGNFIEEQRAFGRTLSDFIEEKYANKLSLYNLKRSVPEFDEENVDDEIGYINMVSFIIGNFILYKQKGIFLHLSDNNMSLGHQLIFVKSFPNELIDYYAHEILEIINSHLDLDLEIDADSWLQLSGDDMVELGKLLFDALCVPRNTGNCELVLIQDDQSGKAIFDTFVAAHNKFASHCEQLQAEYDSRHNSEPKADSKASSAILNFFDSNSNTLIAKLKDSGLQLSAAALQNDQNITRVANVVYNLLPGMVRIFVSFDTVENFLLENRQWLINKLV